MDDVRQIQLKCLEILNIVDDLCCKNDIKYSLCGGSVVGAHLYGGCLPWDDDIDIIDDIENVEDFAPIEEVEEVEEVEVARYDINGRLLSSPIKGVNIVKMSDGSVKKVVVK